MNVQPGDQVRLRPREAPYRDNPKEWWTVTYVEPHVGFDAMLTTWLDHDDRYRHRRGIGFDRIIAGPYRVGADV
jgi:hypothetical protein